MVVIQFLAGAPEHNSLAVRIGTYLEQRLSQGYTVLYDTYCYVTHEVLETLGHFKNGDVHESMQTRLVELGASARFLRSYRLTTEIGGSRYEELPLAGATVWSQALSLEVPMAWKV